MAITIPERAGPPEHPLRGLASSPDTGDENLAEIHNRSWPLRPTMVPLPPSGGTVTVSRTTVPSGPFPWPWRSNHGKPPLKPTILGHRAPSRHGRRPCPRAQTSPPAEPSHSRQLTGCSQLSRDAQTLLGNQPNSCRASLHTHLSTNAPAGRPPAAPFFIPGPITAGQHHLPSLPSNHFQ
jgi:hypothetical protein